MRIEALTALDVSSFLMAMARVGSRGVSPHTVLSDNGTNFHAASRLLQSLWRALNDGEIETKKPEIKWRFNPPYASHYGGVFERLIGAAKAALHHALPAHLLLTYEQFVTALAEVEGLLNSRPLAYVPSDAEDLLPLTPNHFLCGGASKPVVALDWPEDFRPLPRRWAELNAALRTFRLRFMKEIIPHLQIATNKRGAGRALAVGDVVAFFVPSATNKWPLGRISAVFPVRDGNVRTVEVSSPMSLPLSAWEALAQPMADASVSRRRARARAQPMSGPSVSSPQLPQPPLASAGGGKQGEWKLFRRDVGSVVLLLPVEETTILHI